MLDAHQPTDTKVLSLNDPSIRRDFVSHLAPLVKQSIVSDLSVVPFPVQFRNQGVLDQWRETLNRINLGNMTLWQDWAQPDVTCGHVMDFFEDFFSDLLYPRNPRGIVCGEGEIRGLALEISTNLFYARGSGALFEVTPALDTLLGHADVDAALPMEMVVPPFAAQYLRFSEQAGRELQPFADDPESVVDGVFCFACLRPAETGSSVLVRNLQFVFVMKQHGRTHQLIKFERSVVSEKMLLAEWVMLMCPKAPENEPKRVEDQRMVELVGYVAKVFLYLGLKDARRTMVRDYSDAKRRAKREPKLARKLSALYDRIVVGPASLPDALPASGGDSGHAMPPHWRRGHFRMHAHGPGYAERKLLFIAPVLVHADRLAQEEKAQPSPKAYRVGH